MQHPRSICNIQMKHLKHKLETPETLETQRHRWQQPTLVGNSSSQQARVHGTSRVVQQTTQARRKGLPFLSTGALDGAQAQASSASPSATVEVDGGMAWDVVGRSGKEEGGREA
jgi:hypothetical protein